MRNKNSGFPARGALVWRWVVLPPLMALGVCGLLATLLGWKTVESRIIAWFDEIERGL